MIILISILSIIVLVIGTGCYVSKRRYEESFNTYFGDTENVPIDTADLEEEFNRIERLQANLEEVRENINNLDIPTPETFSFYDDTQTTLNKLSNYLEKHSLATAGTEQLILSLLPISQIGQSIQAMAEVLPSNLGRAIFGNALISIKDNIGSISTYDGLGRFISGMANLNHYQMLSVAKALEHHQITDALLIPIKHGALEVIGVHDATHEIVNSLASISGDIGSAIEASTSISDLTDVSHIDITGHIPVVTIALSSFREFRLLSDDKTNYMSSLKNIALDAAGAGVGGLAGAQGGAIIGSIFGPVGTLFGGIIGAVGGAICGRKATNKVKRIPLDNAIEAYKTEYDRMKSETDEQSKVTLSSIQTFAEDKRDEFKSSEILEDIPVSDTSSVAEQIALVLYQFVVNEIVEMKKGVSQIRKSIWFSANKYEKLIQEYENQIDCIEKQLPSPQLIRSNPQIVFDTLIDIDMPNRKMSSKFQDKINECKEELKKANDKNDSSILMWSYMVNNLYQKTLSDIADFSNKKMKTLNELFSKWKNTMNKLQNKVEKEKGKLGLN